MEPDYKQILLQFIASLTLDENEGDLSESIATVLDMIDEHIEWEDLNDLGTKLGKMGVTTLNGTSLVDEFEDEDYGEFEERDEDMDFEEDDDEFAHWDRH